MTIADTQLSLLFGGVLAFLAAATVTARLLAAKRFIGPRLAVVTDLAARTRAWWIIVPIVGVAILLGQAGVIALFAVLSWTALGEYMTLARTTRADHLALLVAFFLAVPVQYYLIWIEWYGLYSILIPVYAFVLLPVVSAAAGEARAFLARAAEIQWGLMLCVYCLSHVAALATLAIPGYEGRELQLVIYLLLVVQTSDVFQYIWGKLLGRTEVAPRLSPAKTVEGTALGIASATALGAALWRLTPFTFSQAALLALVAALAGFLGGLVLSAIKRDRGRKDWGWLIPGHGGVLDRLDSLAFAAPVFFHLTRYWWAE